MEEKEEKDVGEVGLVEGRKRDRRCVVVVLEGGGGVCVCAQVKV